MISFTVTFLCDNGDCQARVSGIDAHEVDTARRLAMGTAIRQGWTNQENGDHFCGTCSARRKKKKGRK